MTSRTDLVTALINNTRITAQEIETLKAYGWDCDVPLVTLRKLDVLSILAQFRSGTLAAKDVQAWANRVEGRDDIDYEDGPEGPLNEAVFWLANPLVNYPIDAILCSRIEEAFHKR